MYGSSTCYISQVQKGQYQSQNNHSIRMFFFIVSCMFDSYSWDVFLINVFLSWGAHNVSNICVCL
jgi:hypothetical protein